MAKPGISIGALAGSDFASALSARAQPNELDDTMSLAMENGKGLRLECTTLKEAQRWRFRFYRRRNLLADAGVHSFDKLIFTFEGNDLLIKVEQPFKLREL